MALAAERFFAMPFPLKIIFVSGLLSPVIVVGSVLTGTILPEDAPVFALGAARNLAELMLATAATVPAAIVAILMFLKRKVAILLFPLGYTAASLAPIFLAAFREDTDHMISSVLSALAVGVAASAYLFSSGMVRRYFERSENP